MRNLKRRELKSTVAVTTHRVTAIDKPVIHRESKIILDILGGNESEKFQNDFMHAMNVFERGKQLARYFQVVISGTPDLDKLCENVKYAYEKAGGYVIFIAIRDIDGQRCENPRALFWTSIQTISMVENESLRWGLFKDILYSLGYSPKTDDNMRVINVN